MRSTVFIHTNPKQAVGALVARHALIRNSAAPERFDVRIIDTSDFPAFARYEGRSYLREGKLAVWRNDDLQSFTPLRFAVPELMGYEGRAVLTDPDIFALADINQLLDRDMGGHAVLARQMEADSRRPLHYASSVMLMDCAKLGHWRWEEDFEKTFRGERDYRDWMWLLLEPPGSVGPLEPEWNDFDRLTPQTRLLHNTHRRTQPWKTGLTVDFRPAETGSLSLANLFHRARRSIFGEYGLLGHYRKHPDANQERLFFALLKECVEQGIVTKAMLDEEMRLNHVRHDALDILARTPTLTEQPLLAS